jgi:mannosyltransferase OCH1-like enzyme
MIPKIIHVTWKTDAIFNSKSFMAQKGLQNLVKLNPDWKVEFSDDAKVDGYLKENLSSFDYDLIKSKTIIEKLDLWRLLKIYLEGGLYTDLDRFCNVPLNEIITDGIECVLPTYLDTDFSHDFMCSSPGNPIFSVAAKLNVERRRMGYSQIYLLGPQTYMHAVTLNLTGEIIESNCGKETMDKLREIILNTKFAKTYREVPWKDTILFKMSPEFDNFGDANYEAEMQNMYKEFDMHHWTGWF